MQAKYTFAVRVVALEQLCPTGWERGYSRWGARVYGGLGEGLVCPKTGNDIRAHACTLACDALEASSSLPALCLNSVHQVASFQIPCVCYKEARYLSDTSVQPNRKVEGATRKKHYPVLH